mmetsp:Transcript_23936/g.46568  ORF Transcript_23936/g.46568 Transcript_23936/m.46568 type:complete len:140 (-) Transcript_23936:1386-1805(-)
MANVLAPTNLDKRCTSVATTKATVETCLKKQFEGAQPRTVPPTAETANATTAAAAAASAATAAARYHHCRSSRIISPSSTKMIYSRQKKQQGLVLMLATLQIDALLWQCLSCTTSLEEETIGVQADTHKVHPNVAQPHH